MGKWNNRSRFQRRRSPLRWYSDRHFSSSSGYGEDDGIPVWEKKFCEEIGSVPWQKVVEASQFKSWYQGNVITWNDSACEETFHNEKKRFWSQVHGRHCDISLPDPDLYISEVDWETYIDPELIRDIERAYFAPPNDEKIGFKRGRRDKNTSGWNLTPVEECQEETRVLEIPWKGSDKEPNDWKIVESSTEYPKDRVRPWETQASCGNEKAKDTISGSCLSNRWETEEWREIQWKTSDRGNNSWENAGQGNDGWDKSEHQNKKVKGSEMLENPWEAKPSCRKETAKDSTWGGCSGKGWEDRGWGSGGGWENWGLGNQATGRKEWGYKRDNHDFQEPKGYNPWKVGSVRDNAASRDYGANAGGWQTRRGRGSEWNQRNWDVKRSNDGWGRGNREREGLYSYNSNFRNSRPRRNDHQNRNVNFSAK